MRIKDLKCCGQNIMAQLHIWHLEDKNQSLQTPVCTKTLFLAKLNPYSLPAVPIVALNGVIFCSSNLLVPFYLQAFAHAASASGTALFFSSGFKVKLKATSSASRANPQAVISSSSLLLLFFYPSCGSHPFLSSIRLIYIYLLNLTMSSLREGPYSIDLFTPHSI